MTPDEQHGTSRIHHLPDGRIYPEPFVDELPIPRVIRPADGEVAVVRMLTATHTFHRALPPSRVWTYEGVLPGPTIEVQRDKEVRVEWHNALEGKLPVVATIAPEAPEAEMPVQCLPGLSGGDPLPDVAALTPWTVVHLHGGATPPQSDGWAENVMATGQSALYDYPLHQRATLLWYHDHAMGVTQFNVYAGLAGLWVVRDDHERELGLPQGAPYEIPLLLQDRNFDLDAEGRLAGQLLHKTDTGAMESFGPYTVVNGKIWPHHEVEPRTYRLRVLNGSNARTFRLLLVDGDGEPVLGRVRQIGSDGGLLLDAVPLPAGGLVLASAERADLLVDFSGLAPGTRLRLINTATAPFDGAPLDPDTAPGAPDFEGLLPFPEVMEFRVVEGERKDVSVPTPLSSDFVRLSRDALHEPVRRAIALVEQEVEGQPNVLTMRELARVDEPQPGEPLITVTGGEETTRWRTVACHFEDRVTIFPEIGRDELWRLINLTGDTHPIHIHLVQFQALARHGVTREVPPDGITETDTTAWVRFGAPDDDPVPHELDEGEQGLKDTIRVNPNEVLDIALRFEPYAGRYMYHCHILEHEDRDMMRPIVVTPRELMDFMSMPGMNGTDPGM
jgi:FtsP/CotA-like multicopper oxidase with cupredoxin domain